MEASEDQEEVISNVSFRMFMFIVFMDAFVCIVELIRKVVICVNLISSDFEPFLLLMLRVEDFVVIIVLNLLSAWKSAHILAFDSFTYYDCRCYRQCFYRRILLISTDALIM